jgi:hypothetical protein
VEIKKYKEFLSAKEWQDLDWFWGQCQWIYCFNRDPTGYRRVFVISYATLGAFMKYQKKVCQRNQQVILLIKVWFLSNR